MSMGFWGALLVADSIDKHRRSVEDNARKEREAAKHHSSYNDNPVDYDKLAMAIVKAQRQLEEEQEESQYQKQQTAEWIAKCGPCEQSFTTKEAAIKVAIDSLKFWHYTEVVYLPTNTVVWRSSND